MYSIIYIFDYNQNILMNKSITLILTLTLFITSFYSYSQEKVFLDENINKIDSLTYKNRCKNILLKCLEYKIKDLSINKILFKYQFGKLKSDEYLQIKNSLQIDSNKFIKDDQYIIIKYYDSLFNYKTANNRHLSRVNKAKQNNSAYSKNFYHEFNNKIFLKERKDWIKKNRKCIKRYNSKFNSEVFYIYKAEQNVIDKYENFNWIKDRGLFKNKFFKIIGNFRFVIIKPDGEYFLGGGHLEDNRFEKLLKSKDWSNFKSNWHNTYSKKELTGEGIFKTISPFHNNRHCL